jgi:hypothetical protein
MASPANHQGVKADVEERKGDTIERVELGGAY